jgi:pyruvate dehydrogenase (quinone)
MMAGLSGTLATMCPAVPYALAAKFAHPDRLAVATVGDGAMQMLGMNELITAAKFHRRWRDPRLVVLVLSNRDLNQVTWEQRVLAGSPKYPASQEIPEFDFARYAESLGLLGLRVTRPEEVAGAWDAALAADRPAVIDAVVDPNEPPMPPHVTFKQARAMARSMVKGDADRSHVIRESVKEVVEELVPGR